VIFGKAGPDDTRTLRRSHCALHLLSVSLKAAFPRGKETQTPFGTPFETVGQQHLCKAAKQIATKVMFHRDAISTCRSGGSLRRIMSATSSCRLIMLPQSAALERQVEAPGLSMLQSQLSGLSPIALHCG